MGGPVRFGILGASNFARQQMAPAIHGASGVVLAGLATSSPDRAAAFQAFAPGLRVYESYDALLASPEIDAVYIPLPNHLHVDWCLKANAAGKHVLCEKPIALKAEDIDQLIAARNASGLQLAEAFMIVHHPQWQRARALLQGGAIGRLMQVDGVFSYNNPSPENIRNQPGTGGGVLPDIGVYPIGAARWMIGAEPDAVTSAALTWDGGVDVTARVGARFGEIGFQAMVSMRMANRQEMVFHGDKAVMRLSAPFNANVFDLAEIEISGPGLQRQTERFPAANHYIHQVENLCTAIKGEAAFAWPLEQAQATQAVIDRIYSKAGAEH